MEFDYDFAVIGGGSGGMAAAKEAIMRGAKKVVCFDYVKPTVHGTRWGLGGTCVNVGCIPKKLMHYTAQMAPILHHDAEAFGWKLSVQGHDWNKLVENVQMYIKRLNFSYRTGLRSKGVEYVNALATPVGPNTIEYEKAGEKKRISSKFTLIAVGGRPTLPPDVQGAAELAITSDDLFSLKDAPGKTLVVGASYIALECAGFLTELGYDTTVAVRSIYLRGFDQQCANKVAEMMRQIGTKFVHKLPTKLEQVNGENNNKKQIRVQFSDNTSDVFDTVMYATGRTPDTRGLNLEAAGVKCNANGKILCENEQTSVPSIYAVGDCVFGMPELTPVAIRAGELLARRLFANSSEMLDYKLIPTAVFTPFEYGSVGYSEEDAIKRFGKDNVEVYLFEFPTLEIAAAHREISPNAVNSENDDKTLSPNSLCKLLCLKDENYKVIGYHFVGLNAGEMCQGYALALRCGATKADFDATIGIHPTDAEAFHNLSITRASGESWVAAGGCGGGKCG